MLYSEGLEPIMEFFVDQNLTLVMTLHTWVEGYGPAITVKVI